DSAMSALLACSSCENHNHHSHQLQFLELLLSTLHGKTLSLIQTVLQIFDCDLKVLLHPLQMSTGVSLHLLLDSQGIIPAPDLRIQGALHGLNHPLAVSLDLFDLLILLSDLPVNLTLNLIELKLDTKNLGLFMLECSLKNVGSSLLSKILQTHFCNQYGDIVYSYTSASSRAV
uniref:Lipid-binding serum glycoprotein N-terminal domain-containing protein n=1 Tax=Electrophorus electricus TaxID=8005 RepID=A0AAY5ECX0_ELEEL